MSRTTIYLMRHGDVYNPKKVLYGRLPRFPLSKEGRRKIEEAVKILLKENIQYIYTSPMLRARQTARIIGQNLGLDIKISSLLNEVKFSFDGILLEDFVKKIQPKLYSLSYAKGGSETIERIEKRMMRFINTVRVKHKHQKVLAVSHGDPILIAKAALERKSFTLEYKKNNYLEPGEWYKFDI